jgi:RNA polymerase sigma-70 factor (ECF subfamily)
MLVAHRSRRRVRDLADDELMNHVRKADPLAFEVMFDRHSSAAFSLAYRMCGRRTLAEDVVQEAFLSLWRRGGRFDGTRGSVRSWLLGAVRNKAIDSFRHESAKAGRDVNDEEAIGAMPAREETEREVERRDDARHVHDALAQLPGEQRRVIDLAYFGGYTTREIADMLDLPAGTVKGRMRLGLVKLRLSLGEQTTPTGNSLGGVA